MLATSDYYLHNHLKIHNFIELLLGGFIIQLSVQMFKQGDSSHSQKMNGRFFLQILWKNESWFLP